MFETFILAGGLAAGILIFLKLFARKRKPKSKVRAAPAYKGTSHHKVVKAGANSRYAAVSCRGHCSAIKGLQGKRFLEREAPALPVMGCTASRCDCVYTHHDDRRTGKRDRRGLSQISKEFFDYSGKPNRRNRRGRRTADLAMA
ncbi:MAG: hypothetical protein ABJN62_19355 [Halioglobus sp.]